MVCVKWNVMVCENSVMTCLPLENDVCASCRPVDAQYYCQSGLLIGGVAYVETYVEACGSLFEATAVATKGTRVPPSFRYN